MRISDLFKLAAKTLKGRWAAIPAIGMAIAMFCICFTGAAIGSVNEQKSVPCELAVTPEREKITDIAIAKIQKISDITAVTSLLEVPATIKTGDYTAELKLTGIGPGYIKSGIGEGSMFPDSSVMPYIVLNRAACKEFETEDNGESYYFMEEEESDKDELPEIDWLEAEFSVIPEGEDKPVISKVCGILADEGEENRQMPEAYISISCAKELLRKSGQSAEYTGASVRVKSSGFAESAAEAVAALGFSVSNANEELQQKWDNSMKEATYLLMTGVFSLLCSAALIAAWKRIFMLERKQDLLMLRWAGMKEGQLGLLFALQGAVIWLIGVAAGTIVSLSLPSFLSRNEASIFTIPIPFIVIILSAAASGLMTALLVLCLNIRSSHE